MSPISKTRAAKDFLVSRIAREAEGEGARLSEIERKMLYFTELDSSGNEALEVVDQFESEADSRAFEERITRLLKRAYERDLAESPEIKEEWREAVEVLQKGDHYLLVMISASIGVVRPPGDILRLILTALIVVCITVPLLWLLTQAWLSFQPTRAQSAILLSSCAVMALILWFAFRPQSIANAAKKFRSRVGLKSKRSPAEHTSEQN